MNKWIPEEKNKRLNFPRKPVFASCRMKLSNYCHTSCQTLGSRGTRPSRVCQPLLQAQSGEVYVSPARSHACVWKFTALPLNCSVRLCHRMPWISPHVKRTCFAYKGYKLPEDGNSICTNVTKRNLGLLTWYAAKPVSFTKKSTAYFAKGQARIMGSSCSKAANSLMTSGKGL